MTPGQNRELSLELVPTQAGDHKLVAQVASARGFKTEAETHTRVEGISSVEVDIVNLDNAVEVGRGFRLRDSRDQHGHDDGNKPAAGL